MPSLRITNLFAQAPRLTLRVTLHTRTKPLHSRTMAAQVNSETISKITEKEREITGEARPVKGGPTAQAQKHVGEDLSSQVISDITKGEQKITGGERLKGGPTSTAQSIASGVSKYLSFTFLVVTSALTCQLLQSTNTNASTSTTNTSASGTSASGTLDSATISKITEKEREITGKEQPVKGGPTAQAQKHANEPITSEVLHDITEGEKEITGGERIKGGPTSTAQSELGKARNQ